MVGWVVGIRKKRGEIRGRRRCSLECFIGMVQWDGWEYVRWP